MCGCALHGIEHGDTRTPLSLNWCPSIKGNTHTLVSSPTFCLLCQRQSQALRARTICAGARVGLAVYQLRPAERLSLCAAQHARDLKLLAQMGVSFLICTTSCVVCEVSCGGGCGSLLYKILYRMHRLTYHTIARYFNGVPSKNLPPYITRVASGVRCVHSAWPSLSVDHSPVHLNSSANTYYQTRPVISMTPYPKLDPDASAARYPSQASTIPYHTVRISAHGTIPYRLRCRFADGIYWATGPCPILPVYP